jgi:hypothetical protein
MRRVFLPLALLVLAAVTATAGTRAAVRAEAASPRLLLVDAEPLMLRGVGFRPAEHVRVEVVSGTEDVTRRTTASSAGGFTMRVAGVDPNACQAFGVLAIGDKGSRATIKRAPGQCASP